MPSLVRTKRTRTKIAGVTTYLPPDGIPQGREGRCTARLTNGQRLCNAPSIKGGTVCRVHGGSAPQVKRNAQKRLLEMVDPTIVRLGEIRDQNLHLPSALGASNTILNRALGKPSDGPKGDGAKGPTINIGVSLTTGGKADVQVVSLPTPAEPIDAEFDVNEEDE